MRLLFFLTFICLSNIIFISCSPSCTNPLSFTQSCDEEGVTTTDTTPAAPTTGYTFSASSVNVAENGGTGTYTVKLNTAPTATVTFAITSDNTSQITVSPSSISFGSGNYSTSQTITLTGVNDDVDDGDVNVSILNAISTADSAYGALDNKTVTAVNVDDDTAAVTLTETSSSTAVVESGSTDNFTIVLSSEPTDNVTVTVTASDSTELSVSPSTLTFTSSNWSTAQEVTVTGVEDNVVDGARWADLSFSASSSDSKYSALSISSITSIPVTDSRTGRQQDSYISAGRKFYIATDNTSGTVYAWGDDTCSTSDYGDCDYERTNGVDNTSAVSAKGGSGPIYPNLGDNSTHLGDNSTTTPIAMPSIVPTSPFQVQSQQHVSCVMNSTRDNATCWGRINYANGFGVMNGSSIWQLSHSAGAFYDLAVAQDAGCVVNSDRTVTCWGYGRFGQYGDNTSLGYDAGNRTASITNAVDLAAGTEHFCAVVDNGTAWCWGRDHQSQLGDNATNVNQVSNGGADGSALPVAVAGGITNFIQIEANNVSTCAVTSSGTVWCWGQNTVGQLGDGTTTDRDYPVQVQNITDALEVYVGGSTACATVNKRLDLKCWGNYYLGDGSSTASSTPITVTETNGWGSTYTFDDVAIGQSSVCAYNLANNEAFCWGINDTGQLGLGNTLTPERTMQDVSSPF